MSAKDIVITCALRTPITRALKGGLANASAASLLAHVLNAIPASTKPNVEDVYVGNVAGHSFANVAAKSGLPMSSLVSTIAHSRLSSAIPTTLLATAMRTGATACGVVAGVESATKDYTRRPPPRKITGVSAGQEKEYADRTTGAAAKAVHDRLWADMIVPVAGPVVLDPGADTADTTDTAKHEWPGGEVREDDWLRTERDDAAVDAGYEAKPADGAAAVVFMTRDKAAEVGVRPIGRLLDSEVVDGIDEVVELLGDVGVAKDDVDVWEIHESSASEVIDLMHKLHVSPTIVNPNGGALALGDPAGAAGAKLLGSVLASLRDIDGKYGVVLIP
ncbi:thiolase-like protein [Lipomyces orientalis]|uniref:Thiolase-like protein n=1 Tax=Lipomyces orientalis TaxID=1233043 RepID=A0ACC3TVP0_9ASCO